MSAMGKGPAQQVPRTKESAMSRISIALQRSTELKRQARRHLSRPAITSQGLRSSDSTEMALLSFARRTVTQDRSAKGEGDVILPSPYFFLPGSFEHHPCTSRVSCLQPWLLNCNCPRNKRTGTRRRRFYRLFWLRTFQTPGLSAPVRHFGQRARGIRRGCYDLAHHT